MDECSFYFDRYCQMLLHKNGTILLCSNQCPSISLSPQPLQGAILNFGVYDSLIREKLYLSVV